MVEAKELVHPLLLLPGVLLAAYVTACALVDYIRDEDEMRLLRLSSHGTLSLTKHDGDKLPPYAILSHGWGAGDDEVTFDDVKDGCAKSKAGYAKVLFCGQQAKKDDLKDFWVDTCCIDKKSSAELSEAITSMFRWYQQATKCYVYLDDVPTLKRDSDGQTLCNWEAAFRQSKWFTRGWTLQELLAPKIVEFWSRDGHLLGTKETLKDLILDVSGIPVRALCGASLSTFTAAERLRWAAKRETTRKEDKAYCLLGVLNVSLTPRYGEGDDAYARLRRKIDKSWNPAFDSRPYLRPGDFEGQVSIRKPSDESSLRERRKALVASLSFDQIDARHSTIKDAQRTTCEWFLKHPAYIAWNNRDTPPRRQGMLWVAGKPGAGKSTLMKFAFAHAKKSKLEDDIILSFFFNARGDDLEKTTIGAYRGLLIQLLNEAPDLRCVLDKVDTPDSNLIPSSLWTLDVLQDLLANAVRNLGRRRLRCFVDALDECDEQQVRDMIEFLEDLGEDTVSDDSRVDICFASRHYPTIEIRDGWRLVLEDEAGHADDLRKYIHRRLQAGKGKLVSEIQAQVQEKANGVFMWVVLVVDILNEEFRRGRIFAVKERLREIPTGLSDLFKDLLRRDAVNMADLLLCLQWILFAKRPLRREEFYFAMVAGLYHELDHGIEWIPEPWVPEEITVEDMNRFVLNSSKGLAELTKSKTTPTVQFIHESVRDFLIKDGGLRELWPVFDCQLASFSHDKLKKCCLDYLAVDLSIQLDPTQALPKASSEEAKRLRRQVSDKYPFLEYASKEVFYHANEAAYGSGQDNFLGAFTLDKWIYVSNIYEIHEIRRYSPRATILYILAEKNYPRLVEALRCDDVWLRLPEERYQFPVLAAFANGHQAVLQGLLRDGRADLVSDIVKDPGFGKPFRLRPDQDLLHWAVKNNNHNLAEYLLTSHASRDLLSFNSQSRPGRASRDTLSLAASQGARFVVQLLLDKGADVNAQGGPDGNALYAASAKGDEKIVQLLLDKDADVNAQGGLYGNALQIASTKGHEKIVQLLLAKDADVNA